MKIFLSHSSRYKPLVRELRNHLPQHVTAWIDEKDLLVGENVDRALEDVIKTDTDFVILFLDSYSVRSSWVGKELEWALEKESKLGRTFVLPIVLEEEGWEELDLPVFKRRKFLKCLDFTEEAIKSLADSLVAQLFAWLSRDLATAKNNPSLTSSASLIDEAEKYMVGLANEIRFIANSYDRSDPLPLSKLFEVLQRREDLGLTTEERFGDLLVKLRHQGYLSGLGFDGDNIFVEEEHYSWKSQAFTDSKRLIARKAVNFVRSGHTIVLDAGSTTLEIAKHLSRGMKMHFLSNLTVFTNSIPAANELLSTASEMGLEDNNAIIKVYLPGGRVRPNTLAIVHDEFLDDRGVETDFNYLLKALGSIDMSFVGTNGIYQDLGFTTADVTEAKTKCWMLEPAKRKFIITHASKFGVRQAHSFANFDQGIEIITNREPGNHALEEYEQRFLNTSTKIIYAE